jgi:hypothetical protein
MLQRLLRLLGFAPRYRVIERQPKSRLIFPETLPIALRECFSNAILRRHEGIAYLFGHTDGKTTVVLGAIRPEAHTTAGSFDVSAVAMARVVRKINDLGLQLVGQAHTHPGQAFHSEGDETGTHIAYGGFISIVVPDYGTKLPAIDKWAIYFFRDGGFTALTDDLVRIVPRAFP